jgi:hypothetical protein
MADATAWSIITLRKYPVMPEDAWQARMTINERIAAAPTRSPYQAMFGTPGRITRTARIGGGYSDPAIPS